MEELDNHSYVLPLGRLRSANNRYVTELNLLVGFCCFNSSYHTSFPIAIMENLHIT